MLHKSHEPLLAYQANHVIKNRLEYRHQEAITSTVLPSDSIIPIPAM